MAIVKCRECGSKISNKAKACPACGAPPKKKTTLLAWIVAIFFSLWLFNGLFTGFKGFVEGSSGITRPENLTNKEATDIEQKGKTEKKTDERGYGKTEAKPDTRDRPANPNKSHAKVYDDSREAIGEDFSNSHICKAGIAKIMRRDPGIIIAKDTSDTTIRVFYIRPDDGKRFAFKCKIENNRIVWGESQGRWRTDPLDAVITYTIDQDKITVTDAFADGSKSEAVYSKRQLSLEPDIELEINELLEQVKKVPVEEYKRNLDIYSRLTELDPKVEKYRQKVTFYKARYDLQLKKERQMAIKQIFVNYRSNIPKLDRFCNDVAKMAEKVTDARDGGLHRQVVEDVIYDKDLKYAVRKRYLGAIAWAYEHPRFDVVTVVRDVYANCLRESTSTELKGWMPLYGE